uniref:Uncharacterized protein n=1 Tax=Rhizophora mucronata TaxID=61149 RepID=A0A2P2KCY4_RHIMU
MHNSSLKGTCFFGTLILIGIGQLFEPVLWHGLSTKTELGLGPIVEDGDFGDEGVRLVRGAVKSLKGVGSMPAPDSKVRQLIPLKCLDGEDTD